MDENSAQAENRETFEDLLNDYGQDMALYYYETENANAAKQACFAHVARLQANQMPSDFKEMYALYLRDEERGDPALRDMRFAGYASAFFTRYLRLMHPDWK